MCFSWALIEGVVSLSLFLLSLACCCSTLCEMRDAVGLAWVGSCSSVQSSMDDVRRREGVCVCVCACVRVCVFV